MRGALPRQEPLDSPVVVDGVTKRFGSEVAVDDVSLEVEDRSIYGFIGPSGSGKTTAVRLMAGLHTPDSGRVWVFGRNPARFSTRDRRRVGYMPQQPVLYPHLSLWENLSFVASLYGVQRRRRARMVEALDFVELGPHRRKLLKDTSGGMQRRLSLASTLLHQPELVFLDEPTAGIDPILRRRFWDRFRELRDDGRSLFVTTQYVGEAAYCDRVGVLARGRLLVVDTPEGLRRRAYGGDVLVLVPCGPPSGELLARLASIDGVRPGGVTQPRPGEVHLVVDDASHALPQLVGWLDREGVAVESIEQHLPPYDDVFVKLVEDAGEADGGDAA